MPDRWNYVSSSASNTQGTDLYSLIRKLIPTTHYLLVAPEMIEKLIASAGAKITQDYYVGPRLRIVFLEDGFIKCAVHPVFEQTDDKILECTKEWFESLIKGADMVENPPLSDSSLVENEIRIRNGKPFWI